jgi:hypothetical protein
MNGTAIARSVSATGVTYSPARLTSRMAASPIRLQQLQSAIDVWDRTDHAVSSSPQLIVERQRHEVFVFDHHIRGASCTICPRGFKTPRAR